MSYTIQRKGNIDVIFGTNIVYDIRYNIAYASIKNNILVPLNEADIDYLEEECICYNPRLFDKKYLKQLKAEIKESQNNIRQLERDITEKRHFLKYFPKKIELANPIEHDNDLSIMEITDNNDNF